MGMADPTAQTPSDPVQPEPARGPVADVSSVEAVLQEISRDAPQVLADACMVSGGVGPEIESLLRDIGALTNDVQTATKSPTFDIEALHADIEQALADAQAARASVPSPPRASVRIEPPASPPTPPVVVPRALAPRVDPLLAEIDAALADDADSLVARANGDVRDALENVFDEGALAGLDDEINRALIEAFGTSRLESPTYLTDPSARISNRIGEFGGVSKQLPPDTELDIVDAVPTPGATPTTNAQPSTTAIPSTHNAPVIAPTIESVVVTEEAAAETTRVAGDAVATIESTPLALEEVVVALPDSSVSPKQEPPTPEVVLGAVPRAPSRILATLVAALLLPARVLTRDPIQQVLAALALATFLAVPIAWYSAWRQSRAPAVGRVSEEVLPLATATDSGAHTAAEKSVESSDAPAAHH